MPEVRVGQHPLDLGDADERAELDPEGVRAGAVGFRGGQGDLVPGGEERGPEPDVREDVPVGAYGRQDDVHAIGSAGDGLVPPPYTMHSPAAKSTICSGGIDEGAIKNAIDFLFKNSSRSGTRLPGCTSS